MNLTQRASFLALAILFAGSAAEPVDAKYQEEAKVEIIKKPLGYSIGVSLIRATSKTGGKAHRITAVSPNSPANEAGLLPNDYVLSIDKIRTGETRSLTDLIQKSKGENLEIIVERDGLQKTFFVKPIATAIEIIERRIALKPFKKKAKTKPALKNSPKSGEGKGTEAFAEPGVKDQAKNNATKIPDVFDLKLLSDTFLVGNVTVHYTEELGIITLHGHKIDVEKVEKVIQEFTESAKALAPRKETIRLRNSWANRAAESITEIYEKQYASREGTVVITPMYNPESILVVGRQRAIDIVRSLAEAYDAKKPADK